MENFDWDDVKCAPAPEISRNSYSNNFNHSEFFAYKHEKHEIYKYEDYQLKEFETQPENIVSSQNGNEDKENSVKEFASTCPVNSSQQNKTKPSNKENYNCSETAKLKPLTDNNGNRNTRNSSKLLQKITTKPKIQKEAIAHTSKPKSTSSKTCNKPETPNAYKFSAIYEKKRQKQLEKLLNQEQEMRKFQSKPAPNFRKNLIKKSPPEHKIQVTIPITPAVLKKSKLFQDKEKRKMEDDLRYQLAPKPLIKYREPKVLYEEPFKPKKIVHTVEIDPFHLHVEDRLQKRKNYDKIVRMKLEEKKKQDEEERQRKDEELVKEFRKMTTFKARPNPFK